MFGRKKPVESSAAILPAAPPPKAAPPKELPAVALASSSAAPPAEMGEPEPVAVAPAPLKAAADDLPPVPLHLQRFGRPSLPNPSVFPAAANQGPSSMSDNPASGTPTFRPEIAKRPAMDLGQQRPATPAAAPTVFNPVPAMPASSAAAPRNDSPEPKVLIIGREISLTGQITACDKVVVEGKVEATLSDSRFVEIAETGQFKGAAEIDEAEIRGRFEGKLSVRGRLLIRGTGKVMGEIAYGQIEVECGGELSGTVQTVASGRLATSAAAE